MILSKAVAILQGAATTAAGTTEVDGSGIDMLGYEGCLFVCKFGTAADGNTLQAQQSTDNSTFADLADTKVDVGTSASNEIVYLDLVNPAERYVRIQAQRGTSTTLDWCVAIRYGAHKQPVDNDTAGTIAGEVHIAPAEGTV